MPSASKPRRTIGSVETMFDILDVLVEKEGAGVTELARELDRSKGTVHTYLATLAESGVVTNQNGTYDIGLGFLRYGQYGVNRIPVYGAMRDRAEKLAERTGEYVCCFIHEDGAAVLVYAARGEDAIRTDHSIGSYEHPHCIASGKAMLASLADDVVETIAADQGLPAKTPNTITDPDALQRELDRVRDEGVAFNDEESVIGMKSVAAALEVGGVVGAIGISGPADRFVGDRFRTELPRLVKGAVREIQLNIEYSDTII